MMRAFFLLACASCASTVEVERAITPVEATKTKLAPVAIVRGEEKIPIPEGARVAADRIRLSPSNVITHELGPEDVLEMDDEGSIVAVRTPSGRIEFKPKTAVSPEGASWVRGEPASTEKEQTIPLERNDRILVRGSLAPGDDVPGGGHVITKRLTGALVFGSLSFGAAYVPAAIAGAAGGNAERALLAPIGGPWAYLVVRPACVPAGSEVGAQNCIPDAGARFGAVMSGIFQALGITFLIAGVPSHAAIEDPEDEEAKPNVSLIPLPGGMMFEGRF